MPLIKSLATDEQARRWLPACETFETIGCYAQTELAHGSDLSRLQTTATYMPDTEEFILDSNAYTGAKWWVGSLGVVATFALVQAQLIVKGRNHGPHLFMVPIRSPDTYEPLPGIQVGDLGPKAYNGFAMVDHGWMYLSQVRIPRGNMFARYAQVDKQGNYILPPHAKLGFAGMLLLRSHLVPGAAHALSKAVTIAVRYCHVRRQFAPVGDKNGQEVPVIQYSMVQHRLFPLLVRSYALHAVGSVMMDMFDTFRTNLAQGDVAGLAQVHSLSCGMKALATQWAAEGIEESRKICGGHGYSTYSGLGQLFGSYVPSNTYEGENTLLTQQTAKYLLKETMRLQGTGAVGDRFTDHLTSTFLSMCDQPPLDTYSHDLVLVLFKKRAAKLTLALGRKLQQGSGWSDLNVDAYRASSAHCEMVTVRCFQDKLAFIHTHTPALDDIMTRVYHAFVLHLITTQLGDFLELELVTPAVATHIRTLLTSANHALLTDSIALVDAFDHDDYSLDSELGRFDGRVYAALWARKDRVCTDWDQSRMNGLAKSIRLSKL